MQGQGHSMVHLDGALPPHRRSIHTERAQYLAHISSHHFTSPSLRNLEPSPSRIKL